MIKRQFFLPIIALTIACFTGCGGGTSEADQARIDRLDSLESEINTSIQTLEEETNALESALDELDTTTVYN